MNGVNAMQISDRIEPLVREALGAAVKQDVNRLDTALKAFPDDAARREGLELAVAISGVAFYDMYAPKPSADDVRTAAESVSDMAKWAGVTTEEATAYLSTLIDGTPFGGAIKPDAAVMLIFVVTATLLAGSPRIGSGEWWFNYLDRVEAQLEATP